MAARGCNIDEVINEVDLRLPEVGPGVGGAAIAHGSSATRLSLLQSSSKRWMMNASGVRHNSDKVVSDNGWDDAAIAAIGADTFYQGKRDEAITGTEDEVP